MYDIDKAPHMKARIRWRAALELPGASQMKYLKAFFESFPWQSMTYEPDLVLNPNPENESHIVASIGNDNDFIIAYTPTGNPIQLDLTKLKAKNQEIEAFWYNPRSGKSKSIGIFKTTENPVFTPWSNGWGSDFVLVVMGAKASYKLP
jgi:hypothetical protein